MHTTEHFGRVVEASHTAEVMAYIPEGDPLACLEITKPDAPKLIGMAASMGTPSGHYVAPMAVGSSRRWSGRGVG